MTTSTVPPIETVAPDMVTVVREGDLSGTQRGLIATGIAALVLSGIGVAWLPRTLVAGHLTAGRLRHLDGLPEQELSITLTRLAGPQHAHHDALWRDLAAHPEFPGVLPG